MADIGDLMKRAFAGGGEQGDGQAASTLLTAPEAERMVEGLQQFGPEQVGSVKWMQQHDWVEKLNLQAHHNARSHQDEFVMEFLSSHDKMDVLIHELLAIEVWKEKLLPHLKQHLADKLDNVTVYLLLYHEAAVANLLEICLFHSSALEAIDEDHLIELVDWCYRKLVYLNNKGHDDKKFEKMDAKKMLAMTPIDELEEKDRELRFGTAMCALTILRYITDNPKALPLGIVSRMLSTHDLPVALVALLDNPPWERYKDRILERFQDNRWQEATGADRVTVSQNAAQAWLALNNLTVDERFRSRYEWDGYRKENLQKVKRHMNEVLFDQLPPLKDLQRTIEEIALGAQLKPGQEEGPHVRGGLVLEQVPMLREGMMNGRDWKQIAQDVKKAIFSDSKERRDYAQKRVEEMVKAFEFMMDMEPEAKEAKPDRDTVYFESRRKVGESAWLPFDHFSCSIDRDRAAEPIEVAGEDGSVCKGTRWRLQQFKGDALPLPSSGKVQVRYAGKKCEALLDLPGPHTREGIKEVSPVVWLTVGLLAEDGFALQLKLKRDDGSREKDKATGVYYVYRPVGGAITLLEEAGRTN